MTCRIGCDKATSMKMDDYCVNFLPWWTGSAHACKITFIKIIPALLICFLRSHLLRQLLAAQYANLHMSFGIV